MDDVSLTLPVHYEGRQLDLPLRIVTGGFTTKFAVLIEGVEVIFEPDDAGELRAIIYHQDQILTPLPSAGVLQAAQAVLQDLLG